jgi:glycine/serine hydroxymethyltransferase
MAKSTSLLSKAVMVEKEVELPTTTGTVTGPSVGAGTLVLAAGVELIDAMDSADYDVTVTDGTTTFMAATAVDSGSAGDFAFGTQTQGIVAAADTIDVTGTATASPAATVTARVWAIVVDVNEATKGADEVDRDLLA